LPTLRGAEMPGPLWRHQSSAGDEVIISITGHASRAMLSRYSHVLMETQRRAFDEIAAHQRAADEKRKEDAERREGAAGMSQSGMVSVRSPIAVGSSPTAVMMSMRIRCRRVRPPSAARKGWSLRP
jgi:hypothetical protein